ncbi:hypothetical protein M407DRAFT_156900 [Tulasnella calospora MUT 4182]|uniref:Uncharacterized protein n=1 Tax=Tulasnella calospora MUT 4182 TaxID=1051891 RepID=A0A0C3QFK9_9AGAM|nr:hypothetical protein M407DRAFT_156900 [Tulasnella calospora MUT 4182]
MDTHSNRDHVFIRCLIDETAGTADKKTRNKRITTSRDQVSDRKWTEAPQRMEGDEEPPLHKPTGDQREIEQTGPSKIQE